MSFRRRKLCSVFLRQASCRDQRRLQSATGTVVRLPTLCISLHCVLNSAGFLCMPILTTQRLEVRTPCCWLSMARPHRYRLVLLKLALSQVARCHSGTPGRTSTHAERPFADPGGPHFLSCERISTPAFFSADGTAAQQNGSCQIKSLNKVLAQQYGRNFDSAIGLKSNAVKHLVMLNLLMRPLRSSDCSWGAQSIPNAHPRFKG